MNKNNRMKYAVIGTGFIFRKHLQAINQTGGKIVDVCDITHGRGEAWKNIVKNSEADAAVILAPAREIDQGWRKGG